MMNDHPAVESSSPHRNRKPINPVALVIAIILVVAVGFYGYQRSITPDQDQVRRAVDNAAYELKRTPVDLTSSIFDVRDALSHGNPGDSRFGSVASHLDVDDVGRVDETDYYEITNKNGEYPVCLSVTVTRNWRNGGPSSPYTSVTDGRCQLPPRSPTPDTSHTG